MNVYQETIQLQKKVESSTERLELNKFCPHCNRYTVHKESK